MTPTNINKNDLRYIKTEEAIFNAYLMLKTPGHTVKVVDICKEARINKTTFYSHYETITDLEDSVRLQLVKNKLKDLPNIDRAFSDCEAFSYSLFNLFKDFFSEHGRIYDNRPRVLKKYIEDALVEIYKKQNPDNELLLNFIITGASYVLIQDPSEENFEKVVEIIKKILN